MTSPHRALHDIDKAPFLMLDPGASKPINVDRWFAIVPVVTATAEARTLTQPTKAGRVVTVLLDVDGGDLTLTVTGGWRQAGTTTITFDTAGDWVTFISVKVGASYYWRVLAEEGTNATETITSFVAGSATVTSGVLSSATINAITGTSILAASATVTSGVLSSASINAITNTSIVAASATVTSGVYSSASISAQTGTSIVAASATITTLVGSTASIDAHTATSIVAASATVTSGVLSSASINAATLTAINVGTGNMVLGGALLVSGGSAVALTNAVAIPGPVAMLSVGTQTNNYFKLPAAAVGLNVNVVNLGSTAGVIGGAGESVAGATSTALATANAVGSAINLVCDGTNWWHKAI